jgi:small-conductance mechanosensitive channel
MTIGIDPQLLDTCGATPSWICQTLLETSSRPGLARAADVLLARPLKVLIIVVIAWVANVALRRAVTRFVARLDGTGSVATLRAAARARTLAQVLRSGGSAVIWVLTITTLLGEVGINLGPLIAGAGIAGVALGFGAQSLVKDFLTGLFMLIEDQYGVGDIIDAGEASGVVEAVTLRTTKLRDVNGTLWYIPNGQITRVANKSQTWSRAIVDVTVAHGTDVRQAEAVIKATADELWHDDAWSEQILEEPEVWGVESMGPDGIVIRVAIKTQPAQQFAVLRELRRRLTEAFKANGIDIAPAQRTLVMQSPSEPGASPPAAS